MPISEYIKNIRAKIGNDRLILNGTSAVIINKRNEVLLQLRSDVPIWTILGGYIDPGEDIADCVIREVHEEAGIKVVPEAIAAVLSGDEYAVTYPNGDRIAVVSTVFRCRPRSESMPHVNDDESLDIQYFPSDDLPENMLPRHKRIIGKALRGEILAAFDPP